MPKPYPLPPLHRLTAELSYDPSTGEFRWLRGKQGRNADLSVAQYVNNGYRRIQVDGRTYLAHRLAFYMAHRREPVGEIDHIDGNRANNKIDNLREATRVENARNRHSRGVFKHPHRQARPYTARIQFDGKLKHIGVFATYDEAAAAYAAATRNLFGEFSRN